MLSPGTKVDFSQLLLDETADSWRSWMADICDYINHVVTDVLELPLLDKELIRFSQLNDVLGSLSRHERPLGPDFSAAMLKANFESSIGPSAPPHTSFTENYDHLLSVFWQWSHLQPRFETPSLTWHVSNPCTA